MNLVLQKNTHTQLFLGSKNIQDPLWGKKKFHRQNKDIKLLPRSLEISNNKNPNEHFKKKKKKKRG